MKKPTAGELIRNERKLKGLSISKLAELTEVSQPYLSQIENGKRNPSYDIIHKIKRVLDIDFYLLSWASGLYTDAEYKDYLEQKEHVDSMTPEEEEEYYNQQNKDFIFYDKVNKFRKRKYVQIEDFLNNQIEGFYISGHKLTNDEIKMLIHLFENKEKNYPTESELENEFKELQKERVQYKKRLKEAIENGKIMIDVDPYSEYDLD